MLDLTPDHVVVDHLGRLVLMDSSRKLLAVHAALRPGFPRLTSALGTPLRSPVAMDVDQEGWIWVADPEEGVLHLLDRQLRPAAAASQGIRRPLSVAAVRARGPGPRCSLGLTGPVGAGGEANLTVSCDRTLGAIDLGLVATEGTAGSLDWSALAPAEVKGRTALLRLRATGSGSSVLCLPAGAVEDDLGAVNQLPGGCVEVHYSGGQCAAELRCRWQLARYEHELALNRTREEQRLGREGEMDRLRLQLAAEADKERQRLAFQQEAERIR